MLLEQCGRCWRRMRPFLLASHWMSYNILTSLLSSVISRIMSFLPLSQKQQANSSFGHRSLSPMRAATTWCFQLHFCRERRSPNPRWGRRGGANRGFPDGRDDDWGGGIMILELGVAKGAPWDFVTSSTAYWFKICWTKGKLLGEEFFFFELDVVVAQCTWPDDTKLGSEVDLSK